MSADEGRDGPMTADAPSLPVRFLQALGNLLTAVGLYPGDHPHREKAVRTAFEALEALLAGADPAVFSFLEEEVIFDREPLRDLGAWPWSQRLFEAEVQRLEIVPGVDAEELEALAGALSARLGLPGAREARTGEAGAGESPHIRYGALGVRRAEGGEPGKGAHAPPLELREEVEAVQWIHEAAAEREEVPAAETAAVVAALLVAVRSARELVAPLLEIKSTDQYTTSHCVNVSILSMSLAEYLRLSDADVMAVGEAGLLHDIGKTRIPLEILNKPGKLTVQERAVIEHHVVEGARMMLRSEDRGVLAAVVAAEHHLHWDGKGGYPKAPPGHRPHRFSRLVQVCDVFDALRTRRPFRAPFTAEAALEFLRIRAGTEFDPELVKAFVAMMERWDPQTVTTGREEEGAEEAGLAQLERLVELAGAGFDADMEGQLYGR